MKAVLCNPYNPRNSHLNDTETAVLTQPLGLLSNMHPFFPILTCNHRVEDSLG